MKAIDYAGFPARKAKAKADGKLRGIGVSCYIEACGIAPSKAVGSLGAGVGLYESGRWPPPIVVAGRPSVSTDAGSGRRHPGGAYLDK